MIEFLRVDVMFKRHGDEREVRGGRKAERRGHKDNHMDGG